ncbi:5'-methylthioadenosine/adenosylhomocysteine nucleosidase [Bacillus carboniphilus]|uniref:adenosylhomocysteine nucleosidase n=1 Tax=Bacillus carboniphilus TaxID=86663 RepID=A0ABY9JST8_9BACI|nr:5'-methylthioadenosine/adenosylhomocysteine nucleosidase [Bacillus carboniphilus]WLR41462.1 5'-methylthioadenosine/adenosylhomocysteine nucleosidase [Bacillus carboniphilus]
MSVNRANMQRHKIYMKYKEVVAKLKIGIIGAVPIEVELLLSKMNIQQKVIIADIPFFTGMIKQIPVVVCISKIGTVNAALASTLLIENFNVESIVFNGAAGALVTDVNFGDVIVSSGTQFWNVNYTAIDVPISQYPDLRISVYKANKRLIHLAKNSQEQVDFCIEIGKVLTANTFVADVELRDKLRMKFNGLCVETEGAAVGQVTSLNKIPYIVFRGISDFSNKNSPKDINIFGKLAADNAQKVTLNVLAQLC